MAAALSGRDSLVVLPTGGGKSLCYQAPALLKNDLTVVVSPLISLMKDQVDALVACGVAAAQMNSSQSSLEQRATEKDALDGRIKLLFISPERLMMPSCVSMLRAACATTFAIDEAHCISHWGHDFRPEYRQLSALRDLFPGASIHAYTATATETVRRDIVAQLALRDPLMLVGDFDRPNLTYRASVEQWHGLPLSPPVGAARRTHGQITVYASWNGATDVSRWQVLGGASSADMKPLRTVQRTGFETAVELKTAEKLFQVRALGSTGGVGTSGRPDAPVATAWKRSAFSCTQAPTPSYGSR